MIVHPDRWNPTSTLQKLGVVIHDSESGVGSYSALVAAVQLPGDRPNGEGGVYGSAYHAVARNDADATYDEILTAAQGPFSAPPVNGTWWHFCIPGRASMTRTEWLTSARTGVLAAAKFTVAKAKLDGFALERRTPAELVAGMGGYCGHGDVSSAWHRSTHTDPGPSFPWDVLAADIAQLLAPPVPQIAPQVEEDDMATIYRLPDGSIAVRGTATPARRVNRHEITTAGDSVTSKAGLAVVDLRKPQGDEQTELVYWIGRELAAYDRALDV